MCHIAVLVRRCRGIFDDAFKNFYIRYNDPLCVKTLKLLILGEICNPDNASEILLELSEYVTSIDIEVARNAVKTTGKIALQVESCVSEAIEYLISFVDLNVDYLTSETCIAIKDLLRKYPDRHYDVLPAIHKSLKTIEEPVGKVAVIWMIGEYGDVIEDAPYILEPILENFNEESSSSVKLEILTAAMKLFFKRPPEVHKMLGVLLASAIDTSSEPDVRDRALLYYRLLKYDAHEAARVVNGQKVAVDILLDSDEQEINDRLFEEFNTLSVIYRKPSEQFVNIPTCLEEEEESEDENDKSESIYESDAKLLQLKETYDEDTASIDSKQSQDSKILLSATPQCDAMTFQSKWAQLPSTAVLEINLPDLNAVKSVEQIFLGKYFFVIASGTVNQVTKFYFFAQEQKTDDLFFAEVIVDHQSLSLRATFKGENPSSTKILSDDLSEFLTSRRQNQ